MKSPALFRGRVRRIHFIGIGGVGMSGIAEVLLNLGFDVHGSDMRDGEMVRRLRSKGATIHIGHREENVDGADVVVRSTAIGIGNPEVDAAKAQGIPVIPRAEMLAELMRLKHGIAIAGSHGKTTTTSLVATVLHHAGVDPTVVIGGKLNQLGTNARLGQGEYLVAEADESDGSFLHLTPTIAVVTNLDVEHVDYWTGGLEQLKAGFTSFLNRLPFYGLAVTCIDAENVQALLPSVGRRVVTYGRSRQADYRARDIVSDGLVTRFVAVRRGDDLGPVELHLVGEHNVLNALAAIAVADELAIPFEVAAEGLASFQGVDRRFSHRGEAAGVIVIDDYGHHPTEIRATLAAARLAYPGRRLAVLFQPHRYTRTAALLEDFGRAFNDADLVRVLDVYAAGEEPIAGADADAVVNAMRLQGHRDAAPAGGPDAAVDSIVGELKDGDVLITLGAGSVTGCGPRVLEQLGSREGAA